MRFKRKKQQQSTLSEIQFACNERDVKENANNWNLASLRFFLLLFNFILFEYTERARCNKNRFILKRKMPCLCECLLNSISCKSVGNNLGDAVSPAMNRHPTNYVRKTPANPEQLNIAEEKERERRTKEYHQNTFNDFFSLSLSSTWLNG